MTHALSAIMAGVPGNAYFLCWDVDGTGGFLVEVDLAASKEQL